MGFFSNMRRLCVFLCFGPLVCGQRAIYNSNLDQSGQAAAAASKLISGDSVTAKAIANQAIIEKQEIETALEASLNTTRLQIQSFDRWSNVYFALGDVSAEIQTLRAFTPLTAELSSRQNDIRASARELQNAVMAKQKKEDKSGTAFLDQAIASIGDASGLLGLAQEIPGLKNIAGLKAVNEVEGGLREINDLLQSATAAIKAAKDVSVDPRSLMPSQEELMLSVLFFPEFADNRLVNFNWIEAVLLALRFEVLLRHLFSNSNPIGEVALQNLSRYERVYPRSGLPKLAVESVCRDKDHAEWRIKQVLQIYVVAWSRPDKAASQATDEREIQPEGVSLRTGPF